ncbi:hypothetical protein EDB81DRAFT_952672 [Dactylonectria macrodidyma]|uniref:Rhodopsin domain-containing protein n=1 Tax=Dactylonectria macrodidyma TaxID=307937 RepID=A0A9P9DFP6_9HYPO|nr:hypothetical protein EDB81DRAFT_952672 [Dactylonectria macrodidyma]
MAYNLTAELFSELGVGIIIFGLRFYSRWRVVGFRKFALDDLFAGVSVVFWVLEATFLYTCGHLGNNIGLNEETALEVPDNEVPRLVKGSKHAFVAWVFYILLIWSLKGVLLFLYNRLTMGLRQQKLARLMIVVSAATFLASLLWHIFSCYPIERAWQIKPFPGDNCTLRRGNYIIITALDIVTDIGIMAIPLPLLLQSTLGYRKKIPLVVLFSSGIFVMVCAILRAYYSLKNIETLAIALGWASREILVASIVVCAPSLKHLISTVKRALTSDGGSESWRSHGLADRANSMPMNNPRSDLEGQVMTVGSRSQKRSPHYMLFDIGCSKFEQRLSVPGGESQDHINAIPEVADSIDADRNVVMEHSIQVTTEVTVSRVSDE